jgi:hypothetical protein
MAVQRRQNWLSQVRVDVPAMRSVESAVSNDFDQLIQAFVTNTTQGYIVRGFTIPMAGAIGGAANGLQLIVDPGAVLHIKASQSGTVLMVPTGTPAQVLNAATNTNVQGAFAPSAVNYVTIDYIRFIDPATSAQQYLWNPTSNTETTVNAPTAQILEFVINISTSTPTSNLLTIATVITDANNNVLEIQDDRNLICRLGSGGTNPNPFYTYPWPEGLTENPSASTSNSVDPFYGGDKGIDCLKSWMDAVMTSIQGIKGTTYWYSQSSSGSLESLREDLGNTVITGSGNISHGIIPNSVPVLVTTGNITPSSNQLTSLASTAGLSNGDYVFATGIPAKTTILNISGSTVTLSNAATLTGTGISVTFYSPAVITAPGQINWDEPIEITVIGSALTYTLAANASSTDISLANDQVAYVTLVRGINPSPNLVFTNGLQQVVSVGGISWTGPLVAGDYLKLASDTDAGYYKIQSVDSLTQVTLVSAFAESSTGPAGAVAAYAFGSYSASPSPSTNRNIYISSRESVPQNQDVFWLFLREDNGGAPRVYIRFLGAEIDDGEDREVSGTTSEQLLQYTGAMVASASLPMYVSALNPGSVPEIQLLNLGAASTISSNQYFYINSSGNAREYYVWFNKDGTGVDPMPPFTNASVQVAISTGQTAAQVAAAVALALNETFYDDFTAVQQVVTNQVLVTNNSSGVTNPGSNFNVSAPFTITVNQAGTGVGNTFINDGDNLTLAIKKLDDAMGSLLAAVDAPDYDQTVDIVASGATPPTSLSGPIAPATNITLPNNSRLGNIAQKYTVGKGVLQVYLNGVYQRLGADWAEVGASGTLSTQITFAFQLDVGDSIEFRIDVGGGGGAGGGGTQGPPGPTGPAGPAGADAAGGPININTYISNYTVLTSNCFLRANCASNPITFTLPPAATVTGRIFYFKKVDSTANAMVIQGNGSELIDGFNTQSTTVQYETFSIISTGTGWDIF